MNIRYRSFFLWVVPAAFALLAQVDFACAQENAPLSPASVLSAPVPEKPEKTPDETAASIEDLPLGPQPMAEGASAAASAPVAGWGRTLGALGLVLGLILVVRWGLLAWAARRGRPVHGPGLKVEVLGRQKLGPKHQLVFLRLGQRILLASETAAGLSLLTQITEPEEVAALLARAEAEREHSATAGFRSWMNQFHSDHDSAESGAVDVRLRHTAEGTDSQEQYFDRAREEVQGLLSRIRQLQQQSAKEGRP